MRASAILREVWRNITSGTAHASLLAFILAVLFSGLAIADLKTISSIEDEATKYQNAGASIITLTAPGLIDPVTCEALGTVTGVRAAGAIRSSRTNLVAAALPLSTIPTYDTTPGFVSLIAPQAKLIGGIVLSDQAVNSLGLEVGDNLVTRSGDTPVVGVYTYPVDGRRPGFGYAALIPTYDRSAFDECWVDSWPVLPGLSELLRLTLLTSGDQSEQPILSQLNTTLGARFDGHERFTIRITRFASPVALLLGMGLGFLAVRIRRIQFASALHAGAVKIDVGIIVLLETLVWTIPALVMTFTVTAWFSALQSSKDWPANFQLGISVGILGALGTFLGSLTALALTREKHLFRYFKNH